jgi:hypothetical protein
MEKLLISINNLPHELEDLISEFNVEHRINMKKVLKELTTNKSFTLLTCQGCFIGKIGIVLFSCIAEDFICSKKCLKKYVDRIPLGHPYKNSY